MRCITAHNGSLELFGHLIDVSLLMDLDGPCLPESLDLDPRELHGGTDLVRVAAPYDRGEFFLPSLIVFSPREQAMGSRLVCHRRTRQSARVVPGGSTSWFR